MRPRAFLFVAFLLVLNTLQEFAGESGRGLCSGAAVLKEMNRARQNPSRYADFLAAQRPMFHGTFCVLPNGTRLRTHEGVAALDDAILFLRHTAPLPPLLASSGMSLAAADHVADQAHGAYGHAGSDMSDPAARLTRHGTWSGACGENLSYGKATAREIVAALIIDDGQPGRKHRANIFSPAFHYAGAAVGPHARYRAVCSIDFAGGYAERDPITPSTSLLAGN